MDKDNRKFDKALTIISVILVLVILLGIGGGAFYFCYIDSISIENGDAISLKVADTELISVKFPDKIYLSKKVEFTSSDSSVVSVDDNGKIKALKVGEANITATTKLFKKTATTKVTVTYGEPNSVSVTVSQNEKQYVGNEKKEVTFNAAALRNGLHSQDPATVSFKWEIFENGVKVKEADGDKEGKISFAPDTDVYKKITAKATIFLKGIETTISGEQYAYVYEKLTEDKITLTRSAITLVMGKDLTVYASLSDKVDNSQKAKWTVSVNSGAEEVKSETGLNATFFIKEKGHYKFTVSFTEEGRVIKKSLELESVYAVVDSVMLTPSSETQALDSLSPITLTASWNKYSMPNQIATLNLEYESSTGNQSFKWERHDVTGTSVDINFSAVNNGGKVKIYIDDHDANIEIDTTSDYTLKATVTVAGVKSNEFSYLIGSGEIANLKITASKDDVFDNEESDVILGKNNRGDIIKVGANIYPSTAAGKLKWYVNGSKVTGSGKVYNLNCQEEIGEYHVYCTTEDGRVKSNVLSIPSTSSSISSDTLQHIGMINGRSVNRYVTCQSDLDAVLEYCFLYNKTEIKLYVDSRMQDIWSDNGGAYKGEKYWVLFSGGLFGGDTYKYVDKSGNATSSVTTKINGSSRDSISRAFYRAGYSGSFSGYQLQNNMLNRESTYKFTTLPTVTPTKTTSQKELNQTGYKPYSAISGNLRNFKIDEIQQTVTVSTSGQLYDAVANGFRPDCVPGSMADKIYTEARKVLTTYVKDSSTDLQKAKFIYDWIIYEVTYDYEAAESNMSVNEALKYSAYYLEGVFSLPNTMFSKQIAVCDGRSKAYLLMCAIEGIPCIRVTGTCYTQSGQNAGGHAWNKVYLKTKNSQISGSWYVVDTTWGDQRGSSMLGLVENERYTDQFFLTTDTFHNNNKSLSYTCQEDETTFDMPKAVTTYTKF